MDDTRDRELDALLSPLRETATSPLLLRRWQIAVRKRAGGFSHWLARVAGLAAALAVGFLIGRLSLPSEPTFTTITAFDATLERIYTKQE